MLIRPSAKAEKLGIDLTKSDLMSTTTAASGKKSSGSSKKKKSENSAPAAPAAPAYTNEELLAGYTDLFYGAYKPEKIVTRAEMCKLIITALSMEDYVAGSYAGYPDVAGDHWATSYIAYLMDVLAKDAQAGDPEAFKAELKKADGGRESKRKRELVSPGGLRALAKGAGVVSTRRPNMQCKESALPCVRF